MLRKSFVAAVIGASVAMLPGWSRAADMKMLSGLPLNFTYTVEIAKPFIAQVKAATEGRVDISLSGPDAVPTFEQLQPVQAGVFQLLFTHPAYHSGTTAVGLAIDAIAVDPVKRRQAGVIDYIDAHYRKLGLKLIAAPPTGSKGFRYFLRDPITGSPAFAGRKIRGTVSYHPMIRALGGAPVNMAGGEIYTALQKGVIDGAAWGLTGAKDFKWYEVAKYYANPVFGQVGVMIFMNLQTWNGLSEKDRYAIDEVGRKLEVESLHRYDVLAAEELEDLKKLGMKQTEFRPEDAARLETLWEDGVWQVAIDKSKGDAEGLRTLARKAGLTH